MGDPSFASTGPRPQLIAAKGLELRDESGALVRSQYMSARCGRSDPPAVVANIQRAGRSFASRIFPSGSLYTPEA